MRTGIGLLGRQNWQYDSDSETLRHFSKMTRVHVALAPYMMACIRENANGGMPVMRSMPFGFHEDQKVKGITSQYMLGNELLVAPVLKKGLKERTVYLPRGEWVNLWNGRGYSGGERRCAAPIGCPPVFYLRDGKHSGLFSSMTKTVCAG